MALPTVTTQAVTEIAPTTAKAHGNITNTGDTYAKKRGFVYALATHGDPGNVAPALSSYVNYVQNVANFTTGAFDYEFSGFVKSTKYYVRAWAYNTEGYAYGAEVNFTTLARVWPDANYSPRTKSDKVGVEYDSAIPTTLFAEDILKADDEIVAIEGDLGLGPKLTSASVMERLKGVRSLSDSDADVINIKTGNVGIGMALPVDKLHVDASSTKGITISRSTTADSEIGVLNFKYGSDLYFSGSIEAKKNASGHSDIYIYNGSGAAKNTNPTICFKSGEAIGTPSKVGIGTIDPVGFVDIFQGTAASRISRSTAQYFSFTTDVNENAIHSVGSKPWWFINDGDTNFYFVNNYAKPILFHVNQAEKVRIHSDGKVGIGINAPTALLHVDQSSTSGAAPVLTLDQADVSEEFIRFIGTSANAVITQSIVKAADATPTLAGWVKTYVQDDGNQLTDQAYYMPIYTLA